MSRAQDWPERLAKWMADNSARPFVWGEWDCCLAAASWVLEATGVDPAAAFRGRYSTATGAALALKRHGAGDLVETATALLGEPLASPRLAQRGDVVAVETQYGEALAVHIGDRIAVVTPEGLGFLRARAAELAWRV